MSGNGFMPDVITNLFSWAFAIGVIVGFALDRAYHYLRVCWLEKNRPLPDGRHRSRLKAVQVDPRAFAAIVMIAVVGWSLIKTQANANESARITADARVFAAETRECQHQFNEALTARARITSEDGELSNQLSDLRSDIDEATGTWINRLLNPPPDIAALPINDARRQAWNFDVTTVYFQRTDKLRVQVRQVITERKNKQRERERTGLPAPTCGK